MAQRRPRRRFTREYKAQAVQRVIKSGRPLADIAAELDVNFVVRGAESPSMLMRSRWPERGFIRPCQPTL